MNKEKLSAIRSTIIHSVAADQIEIIDPGWLVFDETQIVFTGHELPDHLSHAQKTILNDSLILPGFIDAHTHLAQFANTGTGNLPLLPWLEKFTFPQEAKFNESNNAALESQTFFERCLELGTTTVAAYVTCDFNSTRTAFEQADKAGIRAFLGQVWMNRNVPENMVTSTTDAIAQTSDLILHYKDYDKLSCVITPRFAISCSKDMLEAAGKLSRDHNLPLQTHISENTDEIETVKQLFPEFKNYTDVYDKTGCLHSRSLLGHGIHLSDAELDLIKERQSSIVHCPTSNRFLASGIMPLKKYFDYDMKLAAGTDVSAGTSLSMIREIKEAREMSKLVEAFDGTRHISLEQTLFLGTLAGARALGIADITGNFETGKQADFIIVKDNVPVKTQLIDEAATARSRLARALYRPAVSIEATFIAGKPVFKNQPPS